VNETKPKSASKTIWAAGATGLVGTLAITSPDASVGSAIAYLLQVILGIALSHGTDVNRPEIDLGQVCNAALVIGGTAVTWWSRITARTELH